MNFPAFGISLPVPPVADPVATAVRAERLGLDFVSVGDHPLTAGGLEAWTLVSWVAASTSRISVATKVLAVPLRWPAITAKMAESLARLSGGRLILGLGGGSSDEEIRALGLAAPTPGQKISGLEDALHIIRGLWSESDFTFRGEVYRVDGAELDPKPAAKIPLWLGTFGKRSLAVTGRLGDGWIPSLGFAPPDDIPAMRDRVLTAARDAGRDPEEITLAYSMELQLDGRHAARPSIVAGPVDEIVERLTGFFELGFTALNFALAGEGPADQLEQLGAEIVPALRLAYRGRQRPRRPGRLSVAEVPDPSER